METTVFTVSELNRRVRDWLESNVDIVHVEGEVSNLSKPSSGHLYFSLKDSAAQIRCAYFRNRHRQPLSKPLENGQKLLVVGKLTLYETRGDYQLLVYEVSQAGLGNLHQQFERLKAALAAKGLFDAQHKKALPTYPACIGIVTSKHAAALRDILATLARRYPLAEIKLYPSEVQGKQAPLQLINAIRQANLEGQCDVLILARGGGSIEDLWAFNDEQLAYSIAESYIPIVSGVGHEVDFTITDFVADYRAATPTAAAEAVTPDKEELLAWLSSTESCLHAIIKRHIDRKNWLLKHQIQALQSPRQRMERYWQTLDHTEQRMQYALQQWLSKRRHQLQVMTGQLNRHHPQAALQRMQSTLEQLQTKLMFGLRSILTQHRQHLTLQLRALHAVSPLATLSRGYAIATCKDALLTDSSFVEPGDTVDLRLEKGALTCEVLTRISAHARTVK